MPLDERTQGVFAYGYVCGRLRERDVHSPQPYADICPHDVSPDPFWFTVTVIACRAVIEVAPPHVKTQCEMCGPRETCEACRWHDELTQQLREIFRCLSGPT